MNSITLIHAGFIALTIVFFGLLLSEVRKALAKTTLPPDRQRRILFRLLIGLLAWALIVSVWSASGKMGDFSMFPLNFLPILAVPFVTILYLTFSKTTAEVLRQIPAQNLIRLQSFRFFVELLLWGLLLNNLMPVQMSFEGRNFDILSGVTAPFAAYLLSKQKLSRTGLVIWNLICLGLLINILVIAIASMPTPLRHFMNEPSNTVVATFPVSWLPGFLVPLAYGLHFLSLRQYWLADARDLLPQRRQDAKAESANF